MNPTQSMDKKNPQSANKSVAGESFAEIVQAAPENDSNFDPELSVGASINESMMSPSLVQDDASSLAATQRTGSSLDSLEGIGAESASGPMPSGADEQEQKLGSKRFEGLKSRAGQVNNQIRTKPYPFVLGAVGVGFALGHLLSRRRHIYS